MHLKNRNFYVAFFRIKSCLSLFVFSRALNCLLDLSNALLGFLKSAAVLLKIVDQSHSVRFCLKSCHFCPDFCHKIDESFLRFFSLTLFLIASILWLDVQFGKMNRKAEKYSLARYARTFQKLAIFTGFFHTV